MAVIYEFNAYRTPRLLRSFSRQTRGVVGQLCDLDGKLSSLHAHIDSMQDDCIAFRKRLGDCVVKLEKVRELSRACLSACDLSSVEQMIEKRDQIVREQFNDMPSHAKSRH